MSEEPEIVMSCSYMYDPAQAVQADDDLDAVIKRFMALQQVMAKDHAMGLDLINSVLIVARELAKLKARNAQIQG